MTKVRDNKSYVRDKSHVRLISRTYKIISRTYEIIVICTTYKSYVRDNKSYVRLSRTYHIFVFTRGSIKLPYFRPVTQGHMMKLSHDLFSDNSMPKEWTLEKVSTNIVYIFFFFNFGVDGFFQLPINQ